MAPTKCEVPSERDSDAGRASSYEDGHVPERQSLLAWNTPRTIYFRFGGRIIAATGAQNDNQHPNVLRLAKHPSLLESALRAAVGLLPAYIRTRLESSFPEWLVLPARFVLKMHKGEAWVEEFETEVATYQKLRPLQGVAIPRYYGEICYAGECAILLEDVGGTPLVEPESDSVVLLAEHELRSLLHQALSALADMDVVQEDAKLDNFVLLRNVDRIIVLDLEMVSSVSVLRKWVSKEELVKGAVDRLTKRYLHIHGLKDTQQLIIDQQLRSRPPPGVKVGFNGWIPGIISSGK